MCTMHEHDANRSTHAQTHARAYARTHARTHTHRLDVDMFPLSQIVKVNVEYVVTIHRLFESKLDSEADTRRQTTSTTS